jgi:hypothetical protein
LTRASLFMHSADTINVPILAGREVVTREVVTELKGR